MQLKTYQQATLDTLRRFFEAAQAHGPKAAYEAITTEPDQVRRLCGYGGRYTPLLGQEGMPYVLPPRTASRSRAMRGSGATIRRCCGWCRPRRSAGRPWTR